MNTLFEARPKPSASLWGGRVLSGFVVLFLAFDAVIKIVALQEVADASAQLGWPADMAVPLGVLLLVCTLLYAIPRTAIIGAVLLTGYLGGAVATHVRIDSPLFTHVLFGVYVGVIMWGGLYLRDARLRMLVPWRH